MSTILIISGSYFPYATANAVCTKKFEDVLKKEGHRVIYCNRKHDLYEPDFQVKDGTEIYSVGKNSDLFYQTVQRLENLDLPNYMHSCFVWSNRCFRLLMKLRNIGKSSLNLRNKAAKHYIDRYANEIVKIVEREGIDMIMSVSMPFDSHKAVNLAMNMLGKKGLKTPKWVVYSIDAYWSKAGIPTSEIPIKKAEEKEIFDSCDMILFLDTITIDYASSEYDFCRKKMHSLPLPLFDLNMDKKYEDGIIRNERVLNLVFAGTIYDDFRNIESLDSILRKSSTATSAIHIMGKVYPKSMIVLDKLAKDYPHNIFIYGRMPYEFAKGSMQRSDILINLANDNSNQIPSKIFEYIACRKPILNIYKCPYDVGTEYLRKYPLAFNFDINNMDSEIERLKEWLTSVKDKSISYDELSLIYHDVLTETVTSNYYDLVKPYLTSDFGKK